MTKEQHNDLQYLFHRRFGVAAPGSPTGAAKDRDQNSEENLVRYLAWMGSTDPFFDALDYIAEQNKMIDLLRAEVEDKSNQLSQAAAIGVYPSMPQPVKKSRFMVDPKKFFKRDERYEGPDAEDHEFRNED